MNLTRFKVLTFDCYGTLIDWESGIWKALQPLLAARGKPLDQNSLLAEFAVEESAQERATPSMLYSEVLASVHRRLAINWGLAVPAEMHLRFGASVPNWPAFPDSQSALAYLKEFYELVIVSNVDRASFAGSEARLGRVFNAVYTAQDIGSYKPDLRNFNYLIDCVKRELGYEREEILHVAQSLFHDHEPARKKGLATAWIDRRHDQAGWGATVPPNEIPETDFYFNSMADLVTAHRDELRSA